MHRLQLRFPELVEVITIGRTDQGRDILVAKVGQINSGYPKKAIFIEAGVFLKRFIGIGNKCVKIMTMNKNSYYFSSRYPCA